MLGINSPPLARLLGLLLLPAPPACSSLARLGYDPGGTSAAHRSLPSSAARGRPAVRARFRLFVAVIGNRFTVESKS